MARQPQDIRPMMVRLPEALASQLERAAEETGRSINAEIIRRLETTFLKDKERGIEHRLEDKIESATEKITQNSTSAIMMELGPKFEELMEAVKKR